MKGQSKYLAMYNGRAIPFNDIHEFATSELGFNVIPKGDNEGWRIAINGITIPMTYSNEWTRKEVVDDFLETMLIPRVGHYVYGLYFYEAMNLLNL